MKHWPAATLVTLLLAACLQDEGTLLHHYETPHGRTWQATDTLFYSIPSVPQTADYSFIAGMRLGLDFPYESVWMVAETRLSDPDVQWCDTLRFEAVASNGMPEGTGITLQQSEQPFATHRLMQGQRGEVRVFHIIDGEPLTGIVDVGLKIQRQ